MRDGVLSLAKSREVGGPWGRSYTLLYISGEGEVERGWGCLRGSAWDWPTLREKQGGDEGARAVMKVWSEP